MRRAAFFVLALCAATASVAAPDANARAEIESLFARLAASPCQFHRNGNWHDGASAAKHLHAKYDVMVERQMITSTESFIERAATQSSMSSQPYLVRCQGAAPVPSAEWFRAELRQLRALPAR